MSGPQFELLERDGLARLGRFATPHGLLETPALLPVVHPDPGRQSWRPAEMASRLGVRGVISSAYITWRTPPLREVAERDGIHRLLGFDGVVMTDSGAFQQHAYGSVEVSASEILDFQERIGSDIATVLDRFTEPETPGEEAAQALRTTMERASEARQKRPGLLAVPVQGGSDPALRARAAREASRLADVLAVGGVVPFLEQYRFSELADVLSAVRPELVPETPVHLFGSGHPMSFAFAALFGVDLFDSAGYHKFARRGKLMLPEGTLDLDSVRERICECALCDRSPLVDVAGWPHPEREAHLARHNLTVCVAEVGRVRQAIREGTLWELAERRAGAHPALRAGLRAATARPETFLPTEPPSRRAFREIFDDSRRRPAAARFGERLAALGGHYGPARPAPRIPLRPEFLSRLPPEDELGHPISWEAPTPWGAVPLELTEIYPVGPYLGIDEFESPRERLTPSEISAGAPPEASHGPGDATAWTVAWTRRQVGMLLRWEYGGPTAERLTPKLRGERSRRTGRLRVISSEGRPAFVVGDDGLPRPTFFGAALLQSALPSGRARVVVDSDASEFVRGGRSLFSKFVRSADPALVPDASALLVDEEDRLLAVGRLLLAPHEMGRMRRGVAARVTSHARSPVPDEDDEEDGPVGPPLEPE